MHPSSPHKAGSPSGSPGPAPSGAQRSLRQHRPASASPQASSEPSDVLPAPGARGRKRTAPEPATGPPKRQAGGTSLDPLDFSLQRMLDDAGQGGLDLSTLEGLAPLLGSMTNPGRPSHLLNLRAPTAEFPPFPAPEAAQQRERQSSRPQQTPSPHSPPQLPAGLGPYRQQQAWSTHTPMQHTPGSRRPAASTPLSSTLPQSPHLAQEAWLRAQPQPPAGLLRSQKERGSVPRPGSPPYSHDVSYRLTSGRASPRSPQNTASGSPGSLHRSPEPSASLEAHPRPPAAVAGMPGGQQGRDQTSSLPPLWQVLMDQQGRDAQGQDRPGPDEQQQMQRLLADALRSSSVPQLECRLSPPGGTPCQLSTSPPHSRLPSSPLAQPASPPQVGLIERLTAGINRTTTPPVGGHEGPTLMHSNTRARSPLGMHLGTGMVAHALARSTAVGVPALHLAAADTASRSRFEMEGQSSVSQPLSRSSSQPLSTLSNLSQPGTLTPDSQPTSSPTTSPMLSQGQSSAAVQIPQSGFRTATSGGWAGRESVSPSESQQAQGGAGAMPASAFSSRPVEAGSPGSPSVPADRPWPKLPTKPAAALAAAKHALQGQESNPSFGSWTRGYPAGGPRASVQSLPSLASWGLSGQLPSWNFPVPSGGPTPWHSPLLAALPSMPEGLEQACGLGPPGGSIHLPPNSLGAALSPQEDAVPGGTFGQHLQGQWPQQQLQQQNTVSAPQGQQQQQQQQQQAQQGTGGQEAVAAASTAAGLGAIPSAPGP